MTFYINVSIIAQYLESIIDDLTPDDIRHLIIYEDEMTQLGKYVPYLTHSFGFFF